MFYLFSLSNYLDVSKEDYRCLNIFSAKNIYGQISLKWIEIFYGFLTV